MLETRPSKKQKELLSFIDSFIKGNGYGPSYREIMRALDYKSVSTVATHVDGLVARGYLRKNKNSARSLEVLAADTTANGRAPNLKSTQKEIEDTIEKLRQSEAEGSAESIKVLEQALEILGYSQVDGKASSAQ